MIERRRNRLTPDEKREIVRLRVEDRMSSVEIAKTMNSNTTTVCELLKPFPLTLEELTGRKSVRSHKMRAALIAAGNYQGGGDWSDSENDALKKAWPAKPRQRIEATLPGRSWAAISKQASALGLHRSRAASRKATHKADKFFQELREIREARGITREELADKMGIHLVMLAHYELGDARPGWLRTRDWLDALGYDIRPIPAATAEKQRAGKIWLEEEESILRELSAQGSTTSEIVLALKRPATEVEKRLQMLGLHESDRTRNVSGMTRARLG